jgi:hypothetical protein
MIIYNTIVDGQGITVLDWPHWKRLAMNTQIKKNKPRIARVPKSCFRFGAFAKFAAEQLLSATTLFG